MSNTKDNLSEFLGFLSQSNVDTIKEDKAVVVLVGNKQLELTGEVANAMIRTLQEFVCKKEDIEIFGDPVLEVAEHISVVDF